MKILNAISNGMARVEAVALALSLITMLAVAFFQVVMRNIYDVGYVWADILVRTLVLWVGLLGAAVATQEGRHLTIDVLTKFLPAQMTRVVRVIARIFALIVCLYLTEGAYDYILLQKDTSSGPGLFGMPPWIGEVIIPISFVLISFHFFILIIAGIVDVVRRTDTSAPHQEGV